jgi:hypothetical protein
MVLLDDIVEVLDPAYQNRLVTAGIDRINGCLVCAALVHRDFVGLAIRSHGLAEEALRRSHVALCRQQEIDGFTLLVDRTIQVFPHTVDLDVRFIHALAAADQTLVFAGHLFNERQKTNCPSVNRRMVNRYATRFHHFLKVSIAQRVCSVPADADHDHIDR